MDSLTSNSQNILIGMTSNVVSIALFKTALDLASRGHTVLYIVSKPLLALPGGLDPSEVTSKNNLCAADVLKQVIFIDCSSADSLVEKLLGLHTLSTTPSLIIVDALHLFFPERLTSAPHNVALELRKFAQKNALIFASLHSCVSAFTRKLGSKCCSIISLDATSERYEQCLSALLDMFYYSGNFFSNDNDNTFSNLLLNFSQQNTVLSPYS